MQIYAFNYSSGNSCFLLVGNFASLSRTFCFHLWKIMLSLNGKLCFHLVGNYVSLKGKLCFRTGGMGNKFTYFTLSVFCVQFYIVSLSFEMTASASFTFNI